jgi:hypothetical protein
MVGRRFMIEQFRPNSTTVYRKTFEFVFQFLCRAYVAGKGRNL